MSNTTVVHDPGGKPGRIEFISRVFPEIGGLRMSQLSHLQYNDAREDWIRANYAYAGLDSIPFLLARLDELRKRINTASVMIDDELKEIARAKA